MKEKESREDVIKTIVAKINLVAGTEGIKKFIDSNGKEYPNIKLTNKELEVMKGGINIKDMKKLKAVDVLSCMITYSCTQK